MIIGLIHNVIATQLSQTVNTRGTTFITDDLWNKKLFHVCHQIVHAAQLKKTSRLLIQKLN
jgi:hypothetical protein